MEDSISFILKPGPWNYSWKYGQIERIGFIRTTTVLIVTLSLHFKHVEASARICNLDQSSSQSIVFIFHVKFTFACARDSGFSKPKYEPRSKLEAYQRT